MIKSFKVDNLEVFVYETREEMGVAACERYRDRVCKIIAERGRVRAIWAAAHSQDDFTKALREDTSIDFSKMDAFHMDEYFGLAEDAPQKFGYFLEQAIWNHKPMGSVNRIDSMAADIAAECERYTALLKEAPIDITSLGIGENGHIAFNDPHEADFNDPKWVRETTLDVVSRQQQVHDKEFETLDQVPTSAYTLTIPALMSSGSLVCIVPGAQKAAAVERCLNGPIATSCPASIMRTHKDAALFLDKDAAKYIL